MITEQAIDYIYGFMMREQLSESSGHDWQHTKRVYDTALHIVREDALQLDLPLLQVAALMHDYADHKFVPARTEREKKIRGVLVPLGLDGASMERIISVVEAVSYSKNRDKPVDDPIVMVLQDADRLDALGAIGIARTFAYGGRMGRPIYSEQPGSDDSIAHFYDKLLRVKDLMHTDCGRALAAQRHGFLRQFLLQFYCEYYGAEQGAAIFAQRGHTPDGEPHTPAG